MDANSGALWTLALGVLSLAFVLWFRTPKEVASATDRRIDNLEDEHQKLEVSVAVLTREVMHLASSIERLTDMLKTMDPRRVSGRHPRA